MSNTDHPRLKGTHHAGRYDRCGDCEGHGCHWCRRGRPLMTKREAIAEQVLDMSDAPATLDIPGLKRIGEIEYQRWHDEWTNSLLTKRWGYDDGYACDEHGDAYEEPLADWERELLGDLDDYDAYERFVDPAEDEVQDEDWHWLARSPQEFFDAVGEAWVIEGPSATSPEPTRTHYVRVWELAHRLGVESKHVVTLLREAGEYVKSHQSYVADVAADAVMMAQPYILERFGPAPERVDRFATLRQMLLEEERRAKVTRPNPFTGHLRPGLPRGVDPMPAPRPGRNPFTTV